MTIILDGGLHASDDLGIVDSATDIETAVCTSPKEDPEWDHFVGCTAGGDVVQTSAWAAAKHALGLEVCRIVLRRRHRIVGGALLVARRLGRLGSVGYVARGPVLAHRSAPLAEFALRAIEGAARARRIRYLVVQPNGGGAASAADLETRGYAAGAPEVAPSATFAIDLRPDLGQVFARLSASKRNQVRRGERAGATSRMGTRQDLALFHELHRQTALRQGFEGRSMAYLEAHWDALHPAGMLELMITSHGDRPLAAVWLTTFGGTVTQRLSGSCSDDSRIQANVACRWSAIRWAHERGHAVFDLGGADPEVARRMAHGLPLPPEFFKSFDAIKREFGGEPLLFPSAYHRATNPVAHAFLRSFYARISRIPLARHVAHRMRNG